MASAPGGQSGASRHPANRWQAVLTATGDPSTDSSASPDTPVHAEPVTHHTEPDPPTTDDSSTHEGE